MRDCGNATELPTDIFAPDKRSAIMSRIGSKNTKPELLVRSMLHAMGYRFRLHREDLPGNPDIVLPKYRTAIFVHGCFWHQHPDCRKATVPKNNSGFWKAKLERNVERDSERQRELIKSGWRVLVLWECEIKGSPSTCAEHTARFLQGRPEPDAKTSGAG